MGTPVFDRLAKTDRDSIIKELFEYQTARDGVTHICYICEKPLTLVEPLDIDHIKAKDRGGADVQDNKNNWGLTHQSCNRSKSNRDLDLQRYLYRFQEARRSHLSAGNDEDSFTAGVALANHGGSRREIQGAVEATESRKIFKTFFEAGGQREPSDFIIESDLNNPDIESFTALIPIEYLFHDADINPRSIVDLEGFIEEFYRGNPQLLPSLAHLRLENGRGKIQLFDGQHKAAAQLFLGHKKLYVRVFMNPNVKLLQSANFRAHTSLAQLHFPMAVQDRVGYDIYLSSFDAYRTSLNGRTGIKEDSFFSQLSKEDRSEMRAHFQGYLKFRVVSAAGISASKFFEYVETVSSRSKTKPLAYETVRKAFFNNFICLDPTSESLDLALEMREKERDNLVGLMALFSQKVLETSFNLKLGIFKIEDRLSTDAQIRDPHLRAYRICRQSALIVVLRELKQAMSQLLLFRNRYKVASWDRSQVLWADLEESDWLAIGAMIDLVLSHKVWIERNPVHIPVLQDTRQKSWEDILLRGTFPGAVQSVYEPLDHALLGAAAQAALRQI